MHGLRDREPGREEFCGECGNALASLPRVRRSARPAEVLRRVRNGAGRPRPRAAAPRRPGRRAPPRLRAVRRPGRLHRRIRGRDAEETRELLSRYFETARTLIERYGGTVEKFIGDAVMAVWGTPVAHEDDAERAVRAALDLVAAVAELGPGRSPGLQARAGVLTGEAAVTLGAEGQGMVAGDLVNTASRIQSAAEPGTVLVGEATRRATEAAIAYEDAGDARAQGQGGAASRSGARSASWPARRRRSGAAGLEPPFVGRDRELRLVKELFHATAEERQRPARVGRRRRRHRQVAARAGSSRSTSTASSSDVCWHRGPLPLVRRGRRVLGAGRDGADARRIVEDERATRRCAKLRPTLEEHVPDAEERGSSSRGWRTCSGSRNGGAATARTSSRPGGSSSSGWPSRGPSCSSSRTSSGPTRRSRLHRVPARVVASPPDLRAHAGASRARRAPARWGAGRRSFTSLFLEPLADAGDERAPRGPRPGPPGRAEQRDPGAGRGRPAVRGRDGPDAAGPRPARAGGRRVPADRRRRASSTCRRRSRR